MPALHTVDVPALAVKGELALLPKPSVSFFCLRTMHPFVYHEQMFKEIEPLH